MSVDLTRRVCLCIWWHCMNESRRYVFCGVCVDTISAVYLCIGPLPTNHYVHMLLWCVYCAVVYMCASHTATTTTGQPVLLSRRCWCPSARDRSRLYSILELYSNGAVSLTLSMVGALPLNGAVLPAEGWDRRSGHDEYMMTLLAMIRLCTSAIRCTRIVAAVLQQNLVSIPVKWIVIWIADGCSNSAFRAFEFIRQKIQFIWQLIS